MKRMTPPHAEVYDESTIDFQAIGGDMQRKRAAMETIGYPPRIPGKHLALLAGGLAFLLAAACSGYIWFDESYTLALINHTPADIWRIGALDVHPALYYEALHALLPLLDVVGNAVGNVARVCGIDIGASLGAAAPANLAERILGVRLFSIAGAWCTALLGLTHVRHDYGNRAGLIFTALALFTPIAVELSSQIRMYSWAMFAASICYIYGLRIAGATVRGANVPWSWWAALALSGLAAAYLHYYGALTAFAINALLAVCLVRCAFGGKQRSDTNADADTGTGTHGVELREKCGPAHPSAYPFATWAVLSALQIAAYLPWIGTALSQTARVSNGFWIGFNPLRDVVSFGWPMAVIAMLALTGRGRTWTRGGDRCAAIWGTTVYGGVLVGSLIISAIIRQPILIERYLAIPLVPAFLTMAVLTNRALETGIHANINLSSIDTIPSCHAHIVPPAVLVGALVCILAVAGISTQAKVVLDTYNRSAPLAYLDQLVRENGNAPIIADSINIAGVVAVVRPDLSQTFLNRYGPETARAYEAYAPTMRIVEKPRVGRENASEGSAPKQDSLSQTRTAPSPIPEEGAFIYLGSHGSTSSPPTARDVERSVGGRVVAMKAFARPHEEQRFFIALVKARQRTGTTASDGTALDASVSNTPSAPDTSSGKER